MSIALYRFLIAAALTVAVGIALLFFTASADAQDTPVLEAGDTTTLSPSTSLSDDAPADGDAM